MNHLTEFIKNHSNWRVLLANDPYNLIIKEDEDYPNLFLFKYNQYSSDMNDIICQEARGIILEIKDDVRIVCHSFDKFFNYGEPQGQDILNRFNWNNYTWQEKRDGSLMRLWNYENEWELSTSGTIDAFKAENQLPSCPYNSYGELFEHIFSTYNEDLRLLNKDYTYSFELTSPDNKIVVDYDKDELTLIGIRDNINNVELDPFINNPFRTIKCTQTFKFSDLDNALTEINKMDNFEGLVLCDNEYHRVKIKTEDYLILARITDELSSDRGILKVILEGNIDDVQDRVPHLQRRIDLVKNFIQDEINNINRLLQSIDYTKDRKEIALSLKGNPYSAFVFRKLNNPDYNFIEDYFIVDNLEKLYKTYKEKVQEDQLSD